MLVFIEVSISFKNVFDLVVIYLVQTGPGGRYVVCLTASKPGQCFTPECEDNKSTLERCKPE